MNTLNRFVCFVFVCLSMAQCTNTQDRIKMPKKVAQQVEKVSNKIDSLQNEEELLFFLSSFPALRDAKKGEIKISVARNNVFCDTYYKHNQKKPYFKTDFNEDGKTDIFVTLQYLDSMLFVLLLSKDSHDFEIVVENIYSLSEDYEADKCAYFELGEIKEKQKPALLFFYKNNEKNQLLCDTFIVNSNSLVEYNPKTIKKTIKSIEFTAEGCFDDCLNQCPMFYIKLIYDTVSYENYKNNVSKQLKIDNEKIKELFNILNYATNYDKDFFYISSSFDFKITILYDDKSTKDVICNFKERHKSKRNVGIKSFVNKLFDLEIVKNN